MRLPAPALPGAVGRLTVAGRIDAEQAWCGLAVVVRQHQIAGAPIHRQADLSAVRQRQRGGLVAEGQAGDQRGGRLRAQPLPDLLHRVAIAFGLFPAEVAQQHGTLAIQHARMQQLGHQPLHAVGVLVDLFQEQDAAVDARKERGAQQRADHAEVAAPERALGLEARRRTFTPKAHQFQPPRQGVGQRFQRGGIHVGWIGSVEMRDQRRAGPGGGACPGQHGQVEGGEVREAQPFLAAGGQTLEVQPFQIAGDAVAAPAGHDGGGVGFDSPLEGLQARLVVAGKALLVGGQRLRVQRQPKALALQQPARPLHAAAVGNRPGRGDDVDVAGVRGKVQRTGRQVGGTGCGGRAWHGGGSSMNGHEAGYLNAAARGRVPDAQGEGVFCGSVGWLGSSSCGAPSVPAWRWCSTSASSVTAMA